MGEEKKETNDLTKKERLKLQILHIISNRYLDSKDDGIELLEKTYQWVIK